MKLSYNWLKEYVAHTLSPDKLSELLTMSGLEVEEVEVLGTSLDGVVVGHVMSVEKHPNADRLSCCIVDVGDEEPLPIVCGAPNVAAGQCVPVATVGTTLMLPDRKNPDERVEVKIKKSKIRGEVSQGMICAEDELGLSDDHEGIMVLDSSATVGEPFKAYLMEKGIPFQDHVIDVSITPNRPDAISHIGAARDVAAISDLPLVRPTVDIPRPGGTVAGRIEIVNEAPDACRRYTAMMVEGVKIQESPAWLKQRLVAIGLRPRNNIVDITNYVMYECGQPLHAFDYDQIAGKKIIVRFNDKSETSFTTLDSKERTLPERTLLICDADRPVGIAGVMGGENSEVTDQTVNILIESAYFDPSTIRRTAKHLSLQTDASYRFERGVDSDGQVWAAARAAALMVELGGGTLVDGLVDNHPAPVPLPTIEVRHKRVGQIVGREIEPEHITRLLTAIGFDISIKEQEEKVYVCKTPSFRPDIEREIDVIEEIARLFGYHNIPEPTHTTIPSITPHVKPALILRRKVRLLLQGMGFRETYTNSMVRNETAESFNSSVLSGAVGDVVHTLKPISQEMAALRPSMLPGHLTVMAYNQNHGQRALRFMEFGHVFVKGHREGAVVPGFAEHTSLMISMSGPLHEVHWSGAPSESTFHDLKGIIEVLLEQLGVSDYDMKPVYEATSVSEYHLDVYLNDVRIAVIAELSTAHREAFSLRDPVYFAELDWDALLPFIESELRKTYESFSRFPVVERDLALIIERDRQAGELIAEMRVAGGALLQHVHVFDIYEGAQVEEGRKSIAFGLRFGAGRTLKDEEVDKTVDRILKSLNKNFGAELRQ